MLCAAATTPPTYCEVLVAKQLAEQGSAVTSHELEIDSQVQIVSIRPILKWQQPWLLLALRRYEQLLLWEAFPILK